MLETSQYVRKPFTIDAVRVTSENIQEVARWVDSEVRNDQREGQYVKVRVHNPRNEKQTKAFVGDWVLYAGTGYKVYTNKAFLKDFDKVSDETKMIDTEAPKPAAKKRDSDTEVVRVVEGDVVVPKRVPRKKAS